METRVTSDHAAKQPTCDERAGTGEMPFSGCVTLQRMTNTVEDAIQETISGISVGDPDVDKYVKVSGLVGICNREREHELRQHTISEIQYQKYSIRNTVSEIQYTCTRGSTQSQKYSI